MSNWLEVSELKAAPPAAAAAAEPELDVVFVHGLGSNAMEAWTSTDNGHYWPQALADSDRRLRVWTVGYPAKAVQWFGDSGAQPNLANISQGFLTKLCDAGLGRRPSVWVAHSLGGLLSKMILMASAQRKAAAAYEFRHDSVAGLLFLATPHGGSALANVLGFSLKTAKPLLGQALVSALGLPSLAAWLAEQGLAKVCNPTDLIEHLKKGDDGRDTDRARFNTYFGERHRSEQPLEVRVFRETEAKKVAGTPTVMVVDGASADPKLFYETATPVLVSDATGHDHSTICKPKSLNDPIPDALRAMVERARQREFVFSLGHPEHERVASAVFRMLTGSKPLLDWLSEGEVGHPREVAAKCARMLVGGDAKASALGLGKLTKRLVESPATLQEDDLASIRRLGGALVVLAFGALAANLVPQPDQDGGPAFALPDLGSADDPIARTYAELLTEVLQAHRCGRVARFVVHEVDGAAPEPAGASPRLVANAISDPASMKDEDHLSELRNQILGLATQPEIRKLALGGVGGSQPLNPFLRRAEQSRAKEHLRALQARREGLWVDARASGNPYQQPELRRTVHTDYGALLPFALQAADEDSASNEQADALGRMVSQVTDFAIHFERSKRRLPQP